MYIITIEYIIKFSWIFCIYISISKTIVGIAKTGTAKPGPRGKDKCRKEGVQFQMSDLMQLPLCGCRKKCSEV